MTILIFTEFALICLLVSIILIWLLADGFKAFSRNKKISFNGTSSTFIDVLNDSSVLSSCLQTKKEGV